MYHTIKQLCINNITNTNKGNVINCYTTNYSLYKVDYWKLYNVYKTKQNKVVQKTEFEQYYYKKINYLQHGKQVTHQSLI